MYLRIERLRIMRYVKNMLLGSQMTDKGGSMAPRSNILAMGGSRQDMTGTFSEPKYLTLKCTLIKTFNYTLNRTFKCDVTIQISAVPVVIPLITADNAALTRFRPESKQTTPIVTYLSAATINTTANQT